MPEPMGAPIDIVLVGHRVAQGLLMLNTQTGAMPLIPWWVHKPDRGVQRLHRVGGRLPR